MVAAPLSTGLQPFPQLPTIKLGPSGAGSRVGWLVHTLGPHGSLQRPLLRGWESLLLPPQPSGVFSIRGLRLYFPALEPWVAWSALLLAICPVYLFANVGPRGATRCSACPVLHHSESGPLGLSVHDCRAAGSASGQTACPVCLTLRQSWSRQATRVLSSLVPISAPPTSLDVCLFFMSLVSDFLAIQFSVRSGCGRRRSVSTYAAILVLLQHCFQSEV